MKVWIDIDNAPHVNFMEPIIKAFKERKVETIVTARNYGQTVPLLRMKKMDFVRIDGDYSLPRVAYTLQRAYRLFKFLKTFDIDLGFSHGSRSMAIAGRMLRKKTVVTFDYEYVEHKIFNTFATHIVLPEVLRNDSLGKIGYNLSKLHFYPGYKEEVYLSDYSPDELLWKQLQMNAKKIIVSARPPATKSHYYSSKISGLFWEAIKFVSKSTSAMIYIVPRYSETANKLEIFSKRVSNSISVLKKPVNGLDLLLHSDLFIGAGGTMNREAALLHTPSYSLFYKKGGIDKSLEEKGLLHFIHTEDDMVKIRVEKKRKPQQLHFTNLKSFFIDYLLNFRQHNSTFTQK